MHVTAYLCNSMTCDAMVVDLDRTCNTYGVAYSVRASELLDPATAKAKGMGDMAREHSALLEAAGWDGELPAFILDAPVEIDGERVRAFGGEGWPAFCRFLMDKQGEGADL